jgi:ABC-2 type transport system permease protein
VNGFVALIGAEVRRALSRRLFRLLGLITLAIIALVSTIAFFESSDDPNSGLEQARAEVQQCERDKAAFESLPAENRPFEEKFHCPTLEEVRAGYDDRFVFASEMAESTRGVALALFGFALVIAASFVGAEWGSGTMATLLTWEPRRGRVLAAKTISIAALLAVAVFVILAFIDVVYFGIAALRGVTDGTDGSTWWTLAGIWLRGSAIAAFAAMLGAGLATYTRNTAGAIGIGMGYTLIVDPLLGVWREGQFRDWLFQQNFMQLIGMPVEVSEEANEFGEFALAVLSPGRPLLLLALYGALVLGLAYLVFRTRDIT